MHRPASTELLAWALVGAAVGLTLGFVAGEFLGPTARQRAQRLVTPGTRPKGDDAPPLRPRELVRVVRTALARDPELKALDIEPLPVGPGVVELHGWVPSRALRARAVRLVREVPGLDTLVNRLLVEGEDDPLASAGDLADQSA
jgi:hypothetical protein